MSLARSMKQIIWIYSGMDKVGFSQPRPAVLYNNNKRLPIAVHASCYTSLRMTRDQGKMRTPSMSSQEECCRLALVFGNYVSPTASTWCITMMCPHTNNTKFITICLSFVHHSYTSLTTYQYHTNASVDSHLVSTEVCYPYICHVLLLTLFHDSLSLFITGWNTVDFHLVSTES